jgi:raffinose/stachyose/melibiose transport system permease protein
VSQGAQSVAELTPRAVEEPVVARAGRRRARRRRRNRALMFVAPFLAVNLLVMLGPSVATIYYSLTDWSGLGTPEWVGLENYKEMLASPDFWAAARHNLVWTAVFVTLSIGLGLTGALLLSQVTRGALGLRLIYFVPYTIASVVTASVWQNIYDPTRGVGKTLSDLGIPGLEDTAILGSGTTALPAVSVINVWAFWGFVLVVCLAALQGVDRALYEAARLEGASRWQQVRYVSLPGIRPTLVFIIVISLMFSVLVFDYVWITTRGGPAGATEVVGTLLYKEAFERFEAGYAAALGLSMTVVCALLALLYLLLRRRGWEV